MSVCNSEVSKQTDRQTDKDASPSHVVFQMSWNFTKVSSRKLERILVVVLVIWDVASIVFFAFFKWRSEVNIECDLTGWDIRITLLNNEGTLPRVRYGYHLITLSLAFPSS